MKHFDGFLSMCVFFRGIWVPQHRGYRQNTSLFWGELWPFQVMTICIGKSSKMKYIFYFPFLHIYFELFDGLENCFGPLSTTDCRAILNNSFFFFMTDSYGKVISLLTTPTMFCRCVKKACRVKIREGIRDGPVLSPVESIYLLSPQSQKPSTFGTVRNSVEEEGFCGRG